MMGVLRSAGSCRISQHDARAVDLGHHDIQDHEIRPLLAAELQRLQAVVRDRDLEPAGAQEIAHDFQDEQIVIGDQDRFGGVRVVLCFLVTRRWRRLPAPTAVPCSRLSVVGCRFSVVGFRLSVFGCRFPDLRSRPSARVLSGAATAARPRDAVLVHPIQEGVPRDSEVARRARLVPVVLLEGPQDQLLLHHLEREPRLGQADGERRRFLGAWATGSSPANRSPLMTSPRWKIRDRSRAFSSSRTLPGQSYVSSARKASGAMVRRSGAPRLFRKCCVSARMSSRRSRSGGMESGTTFSR